jgi:uncharacterized protein YjbI with pentapeptide repeats
MLMTSLTARECAGSSKRHAPKWGSRLQYRVLCHFRKVALVNLMGTDFIGADLSSTNLLDTELQRPFTGANLNGARLDGASLSGAHQAYAELSFADFTRKSLGRANARLTAGFDLNSLVDHGLPRPAWPFAPPIRCRDPSPRVVAASGRT